uniref:Uncharacterized protein n=1 Tax=Fagus sylvatica TaxID=28930 RepID=A0A2N9FLS8_FAGSY
MCHEAYCRKSLDVYFPTIQSLRESEFGRESYDSLEVGVPELFLRVFPAKIPVKRGEATGEPRVARRSWSHHLSNAPRPADQLVETELGFARYGSANRDRRSVFGPFEDIFPIEIPARPGKILTIREFHTVHERVLFSTYSGLQINSLGELGFARYDLVNRGHWNVPYAKGSFSD